MHIDCCLQCLILRIQESVDQCIFHRNHEFKNPRINEFDRNHEFKNPSIKEFYGNNEFKNPRMNAFIEKLNTEKKTTKYNFHIDCCLKCLKSRIQEPND